MNLVEEINCNTRPAWGLPRGRHRPSGPEPPDLLLDPSLGRTRLADQSSDQGRRGGPGRGPNGQVGRRGRGSGGPGSPRRCRSSGRGRAELPAGAGPTLRGLRATSCPSSHSTPFAREACCPAPRCPTAPPPPLRVPPSGLLSGQSLLGSVLYWTTPSTPTPGAQRLPGAQPERRHLARGWGPPASRTPSRDCVCGAAHRPASCPGLRGCLPTSDRGESGPRTSHRAGGQECEPRNHLVSIPFLGAADNTVKRRLCPSGRRQRGAWPRLPDRPTRGAAAPHSAALPPSLNPPPSEALGAGGCPRRGWGLLCLGPLGCWGGGGPAWGWGPSTPLGTAGHGGGAPSPPPPCSTSHPTSHQGDCSATEKGRPRCGAWGRGVSPGGGLGRRWPMLPPHPSHAWLAIQPQVSLCLVWAED